MRKPGSKGAPTDASIKASQTEDTDPCWKNYKQVGTKTKNGRDVPNCVPKEEYTGAEKTSKKMEDPSSRFVGTTQLTNVYKKATPGYETIKKVIREKLQEGDVIKTKFATKNMQKRGIVGPNDISGDHLNRTWALKHIAAKKAKIAFHGNNARIISKGNHVDVPGGAGSIDYHDSDLGAPIKGKQKPSSGNVVPIKGKKK
jgi:hypothetical protein